MHACSYLVRIKESFCIHARGAPPTNVARSTSEKLAWAPLCTPINVRPRLILTVAPNVHAVSSRVVPRLLQRASRLAFDWPRQFGSML